MRERRYAEPAGDNALLYYRSAAAADPATAKRWTDLTRIARCSPARFEEALGAEPATTMPPPRSRNSRMRFPDDPRVATFQQRLTTAQVSKAMADGNLDRAAALVRSAQQNNAVPAAQLASGARTSRACRTRRAPSAKPSRRRVKPPRPSRRRRGKPRPPQRPKPNDRRRQRNDKEREEQAKAGAGRARRRRLPRAAQRRRLPRDAASLQSSLKRKRYVAPEYPADALSRKIGGVVTVAFTVDTKGETARHPRRVVGAGRACSTARRSRPSNAGATSR